MPSEIFYLTEVSF